MRLTYGLLITATALTAFFALLEATQAGRSGSGIAPVTTSAGFISVTTVTGFAMLFAAVLGAIVSSGEFRHGSATLTYLATPRRERVLVAKAIASVCGGAILGLTAGVVAAGIGLIFAAGHGGHVPVGTDTLIRHIAGATLGGATLASVGAGLGSLVRSQLAAVIGIFVWGIVIESIVGGLFTSVRPYLPYTAATTMAGAKLGGAAFGPAHDLAASTGPLRFFSAVAVIVAIAVLISLLAVTTTVQRDVL